MILSIEQYDSLLLGIMLNYMEETSEQKIIEYFKSLGFTTKEAEAIALNWIPKEQSWEDVVKGVEDERKARLESADESWAKDLGKNGLRNDSD